MHVAERNAVKPLFTRQALFHVGLKTKSYFSLLRWPVCNVIKSNVVQ